MELEKLLAREFSANNGTGDNSGDSQILMGSIGWEDSDEYVFFGSDDNDGHTLIRVQLFDGRDITKPINPNRAQGHKLICHLSGGLFRVPKKDTRCFVAVPKGMDHVPGASVVFATVEKSPTTQFHADRAVMDFGDDHHVIFKGKSVSLQSSENEFLTVGKPRSGGVSGLTLQAKDGSGGVIQEGVVSWFVAQDSTAKTILQMTPDKIECMSTSGGYWKIDDNFYCLGSSAWVVGGAVYLGSAPTAANPALWGVAGIAGVASPSVYISPV